MMQHRSTQEARRNQFWGGRYTSTPQGRKMDDNGVLVFQNFPERTYIPESQAQNHSAHKIHFQHKALELHNLNP